MFTGIISSIGQISAISHSGDMRVMITCADDPATIAIGASIACSGVCLTVVEKGGAAGNSWFAVDVSGETVARTAPGQWMEGRRLNLERALKLGDELGGHIVTGHVDGVGHVVTFTADGASWRLEIRSPADLAACLAAKGSITVDGTSLTVNSVADDADGTCRFTINIIPHTAEMTTLGDLKAGDGVNLEIDVLARYLQRMNALRGAA